MRELNERLGTEFPETRLEFREDVHARNLPFLRNGELDVVFGAVSDGHDLEGIETTEITVLTLGVLAQEDHPLFKKKVISAKDLISVPWVDHSDESVAGKMIDGFYARHGLKTPQAAIKTTSLEFGIDLVRRLETPMLENEKAKSESAETVPDGTFCNNSQTNQISWTLCSI